MSGWWSGPDFRILWRLWCTPNPHEISMKSLYRLLRIESLASRPTQDAQPFRSTDSLGLAIKCSIKKQQIEVFTCPTYSITISSAAIDSTAKSPQSWIEDLPNFNLAPRNYKTKKYIMIFTIKSHASEKLASDCATLSWLNFRRSESFSKPKAVRSLRWFDRASRDSACPLLPVSVGPRPAVRTED